MATAPPVQALLDDAAAGAPVIECSAALAQALQRELALIHLEDTLALQAAALPATQVLAHAGAAWSPFAPQDVERAWRVQAARLRAIAGPIASRHAVPWSLRSVRGDRARVAAELFGQSELLFVGAGLRLQAAGRRWAFRSVTLIDDGSAEVAHSRELASRLAEALRAALRVVPIPDDGNGARLDALLQSAPDSSAWVLPRAHATPARLAQWRGSVLLLT